MTTYGMIETITQTITNGELFVNVNVLNDTPQTQEYRVFLYDAFGKLLDKEPDLFWKNVSKNSRKILKVSTNWKYGCIDDLGGAYKIRLLIQGNLIVDEKIVTLGTGKVSEGDIKDPFIDDENENASPVSPDLIPSPQPKIPPYIAPSTLGIGAGLLIAGAVALYFLTSKK
ncbi:MAG: hypothetical protein KKB31_07200 [Nanoarchaeota archaeon]|nr:hypothetical protein [Nanoarchaeota archaeon]